jgi:hypothetical protein
MGLDPVEVNVLIVTDDDGSFSQQHRFGLSELVTALRAPVKGYVTFVVTTAHRSTVTPDNPYPQDADIKGFRFDNPAQFDLNAYDEVWLFGVSNAAPDTGVRSPLSDVEKRIVFQFMNAGGGVFATGDHEDLGIDLCGDIPRVRGMRRWHFTMPDTYDDYNEASGDSPPVLGMHRHDTLVAGHDNIYEFDDQSDDVPAAIVPKMYTSLNGALYISFPHPLLCGPDGPISILPDHMHEGECQVPTDLTQTVTFDGYSAPEYPTNGYGMQPVPDVIAHGVITPGHTTRLENKDLFGGTAGDTTVAKDPDEPVLPYSFGSICAYDGQVANVGKVVVDSTFHHFFNINLIASQSNNTNDPGKAPGAGLTYTAEGQAKYEIIKTYYRNIAGWIARPQSQAKMFGHVLWTARWDSQLRMYAHRAGMSEKLRWSEYLAYGRMVRGVMAKISSDCLVVRLFIEAIDPRALLLPNWLYVLINLPDPPPLDYSQVTVDPEVLLNAALAGIMGRIVDAAPARSLRAREAYQKQMPELISRGASAGLLRAAAALEGQLRETQKFITLLDSQARRLAP